IHAILRRLSGNTALDALSTCGLVGVLRLALASAVGFDGVALVADMGSRDLARLVAVSDPISPLGFECTARVWGAYVIGWIAALRCASGARHGSQPLALESSCRGQ